MLTKSNRPTIPKPVAEREVTISAMALGDVPDVVNVERQCFSSHWTVQTYRNELGNPAAAYLVARLGVEIVGFAGMWIAVDEAHITLLGVLPSGRGQGIGTRLLVRLLQEARTRGVTRATLEVRENNLVAQRMYAALGFEVRGRRSDYYTDTGEAALLMWVEGMDQDEYGQMLERKLAACDTRHAPGSTSKPSAAVDVSQSGTGPGEGPREEKARPDEADARAPRC